jgi:uncharacterized membrane protein
MENPKNSDFFRIGTPRCGLVMGLVGVVLALLFLFLGFWRTLFILVFFAAGFFVGAYNHKVEWIKKLINRLFPPKGE